MKRCDNYGLPIETLISGQEEEGEGERERKKLQHVLVRTNDVAKCIQVLHV